MKSAVDTTAALNVGELHSTSVNFSARPLRGKYAKKQGETQRTTR